MFVSLFHISFPGGHLSHDALYDHGAFLEIERLFGSVCLRIINKIMYTVSTIYPGTGGGESASETDEHQDLRMGCTLGCRPAQAASASWSSATQSAMVGRPPLSRQTHRAARPAKSATDCIVHELLGIARSTTRRRPLRSASRCFTCVPPRPQKGGMNYNPEGTPCLPLQTARGSRYLKDEALAGGALVEVDGPAAGEQLEQDHAEGVDVALQCEAPCL